MLAIAPSVVHNTSIECDEIVDQYEHDILFGGAEAFMHNVLQAGDYICNDAETALQQYALTVRKSNEGIRAYQVH